MDKEPDWWTAWKDRIKKNGGPFIGKVRFDFVRVIDVREKEQEFEAHVRVVVQIAVDEEPKTVGGFYSNGVPNYFVKGGKINDKTYAYVEEFIPKITFRNLKDTSFPVSKWNRRERHDKKLIEYSLEVNGS